jgi:aspartyl protease family protein
MWFAAWLIFLLVMYQFFNGLLEKKYSPNLNLASEGSEVVLKRNQLGHYVAPGKINGADVIFLLDTGATTVSVPGRIASRIGLERGYRQQVGTANGTIEVYSTNLDSVQLGGITLRDIRGHINPHMDDDTVLLGMSFMRNLEIIQRGDTLTLKP